MVALALQGAAAAENETLDKLDQALQAVPTWEQGANSGPLREIEKIVFESLPGSEARGAIEQKLLETLAATTSLDGKRFLCRQLRVIGTERCIPPLEKLLADPEVSHLARYALERMESPEASAALRRQLAKTDGKLQVGIINTLAERRDAAAQPALIELLGSADDEVVKAAVNALGRLGGVDSVAALTTAREKASAERTLDIDNALLSCAEQLSAAGQVAKAAEIYQSFYAAGQPEQLQSAGLRGLLVAQPQKAADLLLAAMQQEKEPLRRFAISQVERVPGRQATETFVGALGSLPPADAVLLLRRLGSRGDSAAAKAIIEVTRSEDSAVRVAAWEALGRAGDVSAMEALIQAAANAEGTERNVVRASLRQLGGADVDRKLVQSLGAGSGKERAEVIHALAARGVTAAVAELVDVAGDQDAAVRLAAIGALAALATPADLPPLIRLAAAAKSEQDRSALIEALGKTLLRVEDKSARAAPVLAALQQAPAAARPTLVRVLGKTGAPGALESIRAALKESDAALHDAAAQALSEWPDASASGDLLELLAGSTNQAHKELALQGYLRMAALSEDPAGLYLQALKRVERLNDKKAVLEGLGLSSETTEALEVCVGYLDDPALQANAGVAALRIAHRLRNRDEQHARTALKKVLATVKHEDVQQRAQEVLNELDKYQDHILQWVACGPFTEKGKDGAAIYAMAFAPEKASGEDVAWKPITKGIGSWDINLESTFGGLDFCAAYVRTRVWSDREQDVLLELGSDDGVKVWLNDALLFDRWGEGSAAPRQKRVPAKLVKGENTLMLKVVDQQGGWVIACRIRKPDGTTLEGLKIEAR